VIDVTSVAECLATVRSRVAKAGGDQVRILAVSKGFGPDAWAAAAQVGLHDVGENYAQEALAKQATGRPDGVSLHFIGRLQTNKVKALAPIVDVWQTVDRRELVDVLARRVPNARVLIQVNVSQEPQKGGCGMAEADALVAYSLAAGLRVEGLMTVGKEGAPTEIAAGFRWLRQAADRLSLVECSMGMSDDLEIAVGEGATMIRVGSALFGKRPDVGAHTN
jgi:PLP dependent protein